MAQAVAHFQHPSGKIFGRAGRALALTGAAKKSI
jgi:hypothetical protein